MAKDKCRKILAMVIACLLLTLGNVSAYAQPLYHENSGEVALAYHSITYEELGKIRNLSHDKTEGVLTFSLNNHSYNIPVKLYTGDLQVKEKLTGCIVYYGENNNLKCSITEYFGNTCINISPKHAYTSEALTNQSEYLIILVGNLNEIQQSFTQVVATQTSQEIKLHNVQASTVKNSLQLANTRGRSLHVLAQGSFSIPFFVSTGVSEAWATSEHAYSNVYRVKLYQYLVLTALPGDGITLYSRYHTQPAISVWNSPTWPPSGLQSVNVVAELDVTEAKLEAYTHYTALGGNVPLLFPVYDTCDIA